MIHSPVPIFLSLPRSNLPTIQRFFGRDTELAKLILVLDNLETLTDADQRSLFAFLGPLPRTCKALLTSRPLVIATGRRLKLQQLDQTAALQTLADIARANPALDAAPESDRLRLITETGGIRWSERLIRFPKDCQFALVLASLGIGKLGFIIP